MCKVFMTAGIKPSTIENAWKFIKAIAKPMSQYNSHGLGYAAITGEGKVFGERWLENNQAFTRPEDMASDKAIVDLFGEALLSSKIDLGEYNKFGDVKPAEMVAFTLHTRMATSPKGMNNTHPFVEGNTSLIHNGIIRNDNEFKLTRSTCDSEAILIAYLEQEVAKNPENIQKAADMLRGYYACGVLTNAQSGPVLDVFKAHGARLHAAFIKELETFVVSTDDDDIKNTAKQLGFTVGQVFTLMEGRLIRINAITGKQESLIKFTPGKDWGTTYSNNNYSGAHSNPALGGRTSTQTTTTTPATAGSTTQDNVLPYTKKKGNTHISSDMMEYYKAGRPSIERLSDHEIQEQIMEQERFFGRM